MNLVTDSKELLGSHITIVIVDKDKAAAMESIAAAFTECNRIEKSYSRFREDSELSKLNKKIGEWVNLSEEFTYLLKFGLKMYEETEGYFDMTVKSILDGWGYDSQYSLQEHKAGKLGEIELDEVNRRVRITAQIDFGGFGKGFALDKMVAACGRHANLLVNAGGDIYARGTDQEGRPWKIYLEHPTDGTLAIGEVIADDLYLAASNPVKRTWRDRHHLVNPKTARPASDMFAVYTQSKTSGMLADAWATSLFAMGYEQAKKTSQIPALLIGHEVKQINSYECCLYG